MTEQEAIERLNFRKMLRMHGEDMNEEFDIAIKALEKQIPKKVVENRWIYTRCDCGHEFSIHHGDGYYSIPYKQKTNYCHNCGQKLDWGKEND